MKRHRKKFFSILAFTFFFINGQSQETISPSGNDFKNNEGFISYSIGQINYTVINNIDEYVYQGVQQQVEIIFGDSLNPKLDGGFIIYPNPTKDLLNLKIINYNIENIQYRLYDLNNKLLGGNEITNSETLINVSKLSNSMYYLHILQDNIIIHTSKIIKK